MNTTTQRRNKQARVATVSAPAIAEPPADTPPTPPDIQPCANEGLHRTLTSPPVPSQRNAVYEVARQTSSLGAPVGIQIPPSNDVFDITALRH